MKCEAFVFFVIPLLAKAFHAWLQEDPYRVENGFITYGGFHPLFYHSLTTTQIAITLSEDILDCGFACIAKPKCASFNVAAKPDSRGSFLCELLETDMYYDSGKLRSNASFHHYSPVSLIYSVIFFNVDQVKKQTARFDPHSCVFSRGSRAEILLITKIWVILLLPVGEICNFRLKTYYGLSSIDKLRPLSL